MHINWWPSSLKREAGSPAPVVQKTATPSRAMGRAFLRKANVRDEFSDGFVFITITVTLIPGSYGNGCIHWSGRGNTHRRWSIGDQGKNRASNDDPNAQPQPHH